VKAARRELAGIRVCETGIALRHFDGSGISLAISCGLAGGLRDDVPSGAVLIPVTVGLADGTMLACDPELVAALTAAARTLGFEPIADAMLTADSIVRGEERARWAARGFAGVDMETGRLRSSAVAAVRVVLDTPRQELSADWERPPAAMMRPWNWPQAVWLARFAPPYARRAAQIVRQALAGR
jgi:4-hydroxy-3-methylbut-2-enyl diphosphate reductase